MTLRPVTPEEIRAAQVLTASALAAWLGAGIVPAFRPYATVIRAVVLAVYLLACVGFTVWVLVR
ncbi:MAG: hypothetical protein JO227_03640 [Acetobacteraceae bacterium]|nr:hypothetical protein [Acetobacteraceae bacterium]